MKEKEAFRGIQRALLPLLRGGRVTAVDIEREGKDNNEGKAEQKKEKRKYK